VLDVDIDKVHQARKDGVPAYYGDVHADETMQHAHIATARALVLLVNDPAVAERAVATARRHAPLTPLFIRTHALVDAERLRALGATQVVIEEVEAGLEMLARVLRAIDMPRNLVAARLRHAREATEGSDRGLTIPRRRLGALPELDALKVETIILDDGAAAIGQTPRVLALHARTEALLLARRRGQVLIGNPPADEPFAAGDVIYLIGEGAALRAAEAILLRDALEASDGTPLAPSDEGRDEAEIHARS